MAYTKYSLTPASNNAAPPDGAPEGMLPSAVNDTMRDMMSQIRDCGDGIRGGTYTMTAPVITGGSVTGVTFSSSSATITGGTITGVTDITVADGGTGASTVAAAQTNLQVFNFKNRIINGDMRIDQRNAGASVTPTGSAYTLDRWRSGISVTSKLSVQQNAGAVTPPVGFINYLGITSLSAYTVGAAEQFQLGQRIEGLNIADLGWGTASAKTVTLSFQVYSSLTGTFGGALGNSAGNRTYPYSYSIPTANTWTQINITIAGETTGTWLTTNGIGINLLFGLGVGSTLSGTAGAWASANYASATGATSVVGTNGATWYVTGVQLEVGSSATGFEYVNYGTQLSMCQRYYYKLQASAAGNNLGIGFNDYTTLALTAVTIPVSMRTSPTALEQSGTAADYSVRSTGGGATAASTVPTFGSATLNTAVTNITVASGLTAGQGCTARAVNTSAYLAWSAEL